MSRLAALLYVGAVSACAEGAPDGEDAKASTLLEWEVELEGRIGSLDDPDLSLTRVRQVLIGSEEHFYVSQPSDRNVRVYDPSGALVTVIGREGEGPGEFTGLTNIGLTGDTLYTSDSRLGRVSFFSLDGRFLTSIQWTTESFRGDPGFFFFPTPPQVLRSDGTAILKPNVAVLAGNMDDTEVTTSVHRAPFLHIDRHSQVIDTVLWQETQFQSMGVAKDGAVFRFSVPFNDSPLAETATDGRGVVMVERQIAPDSRPSTFRVTMIGVAQDTLFTTTFPYEPVPISEAAARRAADKIELFRPDQDNAPSGSEVLQALRGAGVIPEFLPPVTALVIGQDGSIWLRREDASGDSVLWNALDRNGRLQGSVWLPESHSVVAASGDIMAAVELDEFDVPYVLRYRILR